MLFTIATKLDADTSSKSASALANDIAYFVITIYGLWANANIIITAMEARKPQFGDIIERSRMVEQLRKSGKIPVKVNYHGALVISKTYFFLTS
jgi:hypothetical protein